MLIAILVMNVADAVCTWLTVAVVRYAVELNPLVIAGVHSIGWFWTMSIKIVLVTTCVSYLYKRRNDRPRFIYWVLFTLTIVFAIIMAMHALAFILFLTF